MKALRFHAKGDLRVEEIASPGTPGPKEVLVRNRFVGICGTDLHEYLSGPIFVPREPHRLTGAMLPQILGHEFSGVVEAVGAKVASVRPGDRVAIMPVLAPDDDFVTRTGNAQLSEDLALIGLSTPWGGMAERALLPEANVAVLPDGVSDEQGAMIEPAAVVLHAADRAGIRAGSSVLVSGAGPIGVLACLAVRAAGAGIVVLSEPDPSRRAVAGRLDIADLLIDPASAGAIEAVRGASEGGRGIDAVLECSGNERALDFAIRAARKRGSVVLVGLPTKHSSVDVEAIVTKDLTVAGSWCYVPTMWPRVIALVASGRFPVERALTARIGLDQAVPKGFEVLTKGGGGALKILIDMTLS